MDHSPEIGVELRTSRCGQARSGSKKIVVRPAAYFATPSVPGWKKKDLPMLDSHLTPMFPGKLKFVLAAILFCCPWTAWGHAILMDATPAAHQVVNGRTVPVKLRFNSRIDGKRSRVALVGPDGRERAITINGQPSPDTLTATVEGLMPGLYILRWQVLAADGHITRGEVPFQAQ